MKTHDLKVWPEPFHAMKMGLKPFELRRNDRDYQVGDLLILREWRPATEEYTGEKLERRVAFILSESNFGLKPGYIAMGVVPTGNASDYLASMNELSRFTTEMEKKQAARIAELEKALEPMAAALGNEIRITIGNVDQVFYNFIETGNFRHAAEVLKKGKQ